MAWITPELRPRPSGPGEARLREGAASRAPGAKLAPKAVVGRVSLYLRQLESFQRQGHTTVSSSQLGEPLSIKNAQVRKDLAFFGQFGHPGYRLPHRRVDPLPCGRSWESTATGHSPWSGLGNLGRALLQYRGFRSRRFHIVALFDNDPAQDRPDPRGTERRADRRSAEGGGHAEDHIWRCSACRPRPPSGWPTRWSPAASRES